MAFVSKRSLEAVRALARTRDEDVERIQLERLNPVWERAVAGIPYYADLVRSGAPRRFRSLAEYRASVPILTKPMLREDYSRFCFARPGPDLHRITGGSTSVPLQIPAWQKEFDATRFDSWVGRGWYDVRPSDRLFLYWGHAHLLGTGWRRYKNVALRQIKDRLQNYQRHSCYDMSPAAMTKAAEAIGRSRARFVIGYATSLDRLARFCRSEGRRLDSLGIKLVIATAEAFPQADSAEVVGGVFGAPVAMEYGSVETNLVAQTPPDGGFRVFWWNQLLEHDRADSEPVIVTSLYERCTPLFRYALGDDFVAGAGLRRTEGGSVIAFARVLGRSNSQIELPSGRAIHSEAATHIVRDLPNVTGFQLVVSPEAIRLDVTVSAELGPEQIERIKAKAKQVDPEFGELLEVRRVDGLAQSVAGKTPMILYSRPSAAVAGRE